MKTCDDVRTLTVRPWFLMFSIAIACGGSAVGQTTTWTGAVSAAWATPGNWSAGLPTATVDVVVPSGTPNQPSTAGAGGATCRNLTVNAGATLTVAVLQNLSVFGNATATGAIAGGGSLVMTGATAATLFSGTYPNLTIDKSGSTLTASGTPNVSLVLTLLNGTLSIPNGATLRLLPGGAASFTGGALGGGASSGALDLDGNVAFVGTTAATPFPNVTCAGNWQADASFVPPSGTVVFDTVGGASQTVSGAGPTFNNLTTGINSIVTFSTATTVNGATLIQGTATANAVLTTAGAFQLNLGGTFNGGAFTHPIGGNVTVNGVLNGATTFLLNGSNNATVAGNAALKSLTVQKSPTATAVTMSGPVTMNGTLAVNAGTLNLSITTTVNGNCAFAGGVVAGSTLDANGNVVFSGAACTGAFNANVAGDWTSNALFAPTGGTVTFDGGASKSIFGTPVRFFGLTVAAGTTLVQTVPVEIDGALTVGGVLTSQAPLDCDGAATVQAAAQWNAGAFTHAFGTTLSIAAATLNAVGGTFLFDGFSAGSVSSTPILPNLVIAKIGGATFGTNGVTVNGSMQFQSGNLTTTATVVNGPVTMTGGIYSGGALDVNGPTTFGGTLCVNAGTISVTGLWTADGFFNPTSGTVAFDGTTGQTMVGAAANFPSLVVAASANVATALPLSIKGALTVNGVLTTTSSVDVLNDATVASTGTLNLGSATHAFGGSTTFTGIMNATGTFVYDRAGFCAVTTAVGNVLPHVTVAKSANAQVAFNTANMTLTTLTQNSGTISVGGTLVSVIGDATFNGGGLTGPASFSTNPPDGSVTTLDVGGDVAFNGTSCILAPNINCANDWTAHPSFDPQQGRVTFDGVGNHALLGANAKFYSLTVNPNYSLTVPTNLDLANNLTVGGVFATTGAMTVGGDVAVNAGVMSPGPATHLFYGDFVSTGVVQPTGAVVMAGPVAASLKVPTTAPSITIAKATNGSVALTGDTAVSGGFLLQSGAFLANTFDLTVTGDATFAGGSFTASASGVVDVAGDVSFTGTLCTGNVELEVGGDWVANGNFFPTSGTVRFDGVSPQTLSGGPLRFPSVDVDILSSVSTALDVVLSGGLTVGTAGVFQTSAAMNVGGNVSAAANSVLALGGAIHTFHAGFTTNGSLSAAGGFVFDGDGSSTLSSLISAFPATLVIGPGSFATAGTLAIDGSLTLAQGSLSIGGTTVVSGAAAFSGGTLLGAGTLDVAGAVVLSGTYCTASPNVFCGGNWTGHVNYAPTAGTVTLDGAVPRQILGDSVVFPSFVVANGATVSTATPVEMRGTTSVVGTLTTTSTLRCVGATDVPTTGVMNLGTGTHRFGASYSAAGTVNASGTFVFDGLGGVSTVSSTLSPLPTVRIESGAQTVTLSSGLTVAGSFTCANGNLQLAGTPLPVTVLGSAALSGGAITSANGVFDVNGDVVFNGTIATGIGTIRCGGNWTSGPNFVPTSGAIELDGTAPTAILPAVLGQPVNFFNLTTKNGVKTLLGALNLFGNASLVENGSTLSIPNGSRIDAYGVALTVNGALAVDGGGTASFDPASNLTVAPIGRLRLVGTPALLASLDGSSGGGYGLTVGGVLEAQHFLVRRMGAAGMVLQHTTQIAATPLDFRDGTLDFPRNTPGAVLLDVSQPLPTTFSNLAFQNSAGAVGVFNAKAPTGSAAISMLNATGAFSGAGFESDPFAKIAWTSGVLTQLAAFNVAPGAGSATITWSTLVETGVVAYVLERAVSSGGAFAPVLVTPAAGVPTSYSHVDPGLIAGTNYTWRLSEFNGVGTTTLGAATATPTSAAPPANLFTVGSPGFPTIQSALTAAVLPNSVVKVPNGAAFASFTINGGAPGLTKVAADVGAAVSISTTTGAVTISNVPAGKTVELSGLTIGSAAGAHPAVLVQNCAGLVILDELSLTGGVAQPALRVINSPNVCVQRVFAIGTPSLSFQTASTVYVSSTFAGNVTLSGASTMVDCQLSLTGTVTTLGGSTRSTFLGVMPDLALPDFGALATPVTAGVKTFPNSPWFIGLQGGYELLLLAPLVEMPILINPFLAGFSFVANGVGDPLGNASTAFFLPPDAGLLGVTFSFQVLTSDLAGSGTFRMSGGESVTVVP